MNECWRCENSLGGHRTTCPVCKIKICQECRMKKDYHCPACMVWFCSYPCMEVHDSIHARQEQAKIEKEIGL